MTTAQPAGGDLDPPGSRPLDSVAFDRAAGYYDESRGLCPEVQELVADRIEEAAGPGARLLEVGVGTGRIALPLHRRGRRVVGVDLSLPMLERYRYSTPRGHHREDGRLPRADTVRDGQDGLSVTLPVLVDKPHGR